MTVRVEFKHVPAGADDYQTAATLTVDADGTYDVDDPQGLIDLDAAALLVDVDGVVARITFSDDPYAWATHAADVFRTGYLVPVVTRAEE